MTRSIAIAAALCAALAGCGGSTTRTITEPTSASGQTGSTATAPTGPPITITTPTGTTTVPPAQPTGGTLSQAEASVRKQGFNVDDPGDYQPAQTLRVLVGTRTGSSDGFAKRAFFFAGGRFLGTDTSDDSADITVDNQSDSVVTLAYRLYRRNEPLCCPTGGVAKVRYRWNGSSLTPLDTIPSSSASASLSRL